MTEEKFLKDLRERCKGHGAQKRVAREVGISEAYLSDVLNGKAGIGDGLANAFGYRRVVNFQKLNPETAVA